MTRIVNVTVCALTSSQIMVIEYDGNEMCTIQQLFETRYPSFITPDDGGTPEEWMAALKLVKSTVQPTDGSPKILRLTQTLADAAARSGGGPLAPINIHLVAVLRGGSQ